MYVWQISRIEWIILHVVAQTAKECSEVVTSTTVSLRMNTSVWWGSHVQAVFVQIVDNCTYSSAHVPKHPPFAWMNEKYKSAVNNKLIAQRFEFEKVIFIQELTQSEYEETHYNMYAIIQPSCLVKERSLTKSTKARRADQSSHSTMKLSYTTNIHNKKMFIRTSPISTFSALLQGLRWSNVAK